MDNPRELQGWKQIADHLHVTERTAQNWARQRRLPVHHLPGLKGRVFATTTEVDSWKLTGPDTPPPPNRKAITVRLPEHQLQTLRPLIGSQFASMQEFVSLAIAHYAQEIELTPSNTNKGGLRIIEEQQRMGSGRWIKGVLGVA